MILSQSAKISEASTFEENRCWIHDILYLCIIIVICILTGVYVPHNKKQCIVYSSQLICRSIYHIYMYVNNSIPSLSCGITGNGCSFTFQLSGNGPCGAYLHDYCSVY